MRPTPLVSVDQVAAVIEAYLDRLADFARRLGVPSGTVAAVVQRSGIAMIDACAEAPENVVDMVGRWAADTRTLAVRLRASGQAGSRTQATQVVARRGRQDGADPGLVTGGTEAKATARALAKLDERRRMALLLRDSYDAPPLAVAVALGVGVAEAQTIVAEARLRLLEATGRDAPELGGHVPVAGMGLGALGVLADGSDDEDSDQQTRLLRRHVGSCEICAGMLDGQTKSRIAMSGLPVLALPDAERDPLLRTLLDRAESTLPTAAEVTEIESRPERIFPRGVVAAALVVAALVGVAIGAIINAGGGSKTPVASPTSTALTIGQETPTATDSATSTASPSSSVTPTPSSPLSTAVVVLPTSSPKPTPSRSRKVTPTKKPTTVVSTTPTAVATSASPTPSTVASSEQTAPASITLSTSSPTAGQTVTVTGENFTPGATVTITSSDPSAQGGSATAGSSGTFTGTFTAGTGGGLLARQWTVTATDGNKTPATATYTE